ncbi:MAG: preprotein translocase subunit YajC [Clostridia bacterium]|nr:preprotein translocase subunit YajC [Clostridia bacterium]
MNLLLAENAGGASNYILLGVLVVLLAVMFILPMITGKKQRKEYGEMINSLSPGDEILTRGGILGKITRVVKENGAVKSVMITTGEKGKEQSLEVEVYHIEFVLNQPNRKEEVKAEPVEEKAQEEEKVEEKPTQTKPQAKKSTKKSK